MLIKYNKDEVEEMIQVSYEYYMGLIELIELNSVIHNEVLGRIIDECINDWYVCSICNIDRYNNNSCKW